MGGVLSLYRCQIIHFSGSSLAAGTVTDPGIAETLGQLTHFLNTVGAKSRLRLPSVRESEIILNEPNQDLWTMYYSCCFGEHSIISCALFMSQGHRLVYIQTSDGTTRFYQVPTASIVALLFVRPLHHCISCCLPGATVPLYSRHNLHSAMYQVLQTGTVISGL